MRGRKTGLRSIAGGAEPPEPPEPAAESAVELEAELAGQPVSKLVEGVVAALIGIASRNSSVPAAKAAAALIREMEIAQEPKLHERRIELYLSTGKYGALVEYLAKIGASMDDVYSLIGTPEGVDLDEHFQRGLTVARLEKLAVESRKRKS